MGDMDRLAVSAGAQDVGGPPGVHTIRVHGFLSFPVVQDVIRRLDRAVASDATMQAIVIDTLEIDGFEPGIPARLVQWLGNNTEQVRVAVLATLSPVLTATVRAAELLLRNTSLAVAPTRAEAQYAAQHLLNTRPRVSTGTRQRSTTGETLTRKASGSSNE